METKPLYASEMLLLLQRCIKEFGDMPVGAYAAEYCYEIGMPKDLMKVSLRVMSSYASSSAENLPGIDLAQDDSTTASPKFLAIFYHDQ